MGRLNHLGTRFLEELRTIKAYQVLVMLAMCGAVAAAFLPPGHKWAGVTTLSAAVLFVVLMPAIVFESIAEVSRAAKQRPFLDGRSILAAATGLVCAFLFAVVTTCIITLNAGPELLSRFLVDFASRYLSV